MSMSVPTHNTMERTLTFPSQASSFEGQPLAMHSNGLASEGSPKKAHVKVDEIQQLVGGGSHISRE